MPASCGTASNVTRFGVVIYQADDVDHALQLMAGCGSQFVRMGIDSIYQGWADQVVPKAAKYGMRVIFISPYRSQPVNVTSYAALCAQIHRRYAAYDPIWEIWNEPNLPQYWGAAPNVNNYANLALATAKQLFAAGATQVWSGGTSGIDVRWSFALLQLGVFGVLNGCAVHSYKDPGAASADYVALQKLLPSNYPIHTTETCVPSSTDDQSAFLQGMWSIHRSLGLPTLIWCELRDFTAGAAPPYNFPYGMLWSTYRPKDVYYTAKSLTSNCS